MGDFIRDEALIFLESLYAGLKVMAGYDILRLIRIIKTHSRILAGIEDYIYWTVSGIYIFVQIYTYNNGTLRWFIILGIILGGLVYEKAFGIKNLLQKPVMRVKIFIRTKVEAVKNKNGKKLREKKEIQ